MPNLFSTEGAHLTVIDDRLENARARTSAGMAHFGGTGPEAKTCRECIQWTDCGHGGGYYAKKGMSGGAIKPRSCEKFRALMQGTIGPKVPANSAACKYFEQNDKPPAAFA